MADEPETTEEDAGSDGEGEGEGEKKGGKLPVKKLALFVVLPLLLLGAAGGAVYVSGLADPLLGKTEEEGEHLMAEEEAQTPSVFYQLPDMLVNLNSSGRKTAFLKISVSLELGAEEDKEKVETSLPRVVDSFQVYLRELRVEDLHGSAGLQRLREELLIRVSKASGASEVRDVLFREMLVQ